MKSFSNISAKFMLCMVAIMACLGCAQQLDQLPESGVSPDQISEANIPFFLNGLYRRATPDRDNYVLHDTRGGNYTWTALSGNSSAYGALITGNNVDDRLSYSANIWSHAYRNIYNANILIEACDRLGGNLNSIKAETSYLRAWLYYQLVTTFGGVPLVLVNTTENIPRNSEAEVWNQIIVDIDYAIENALPYAQTGNKKVSQEAAKALKSRVLLALGQTAEAAELAASVIESTGLQLDADYGGIFRETDGSTEVLFAFSNLKTESNIRMSSLFWPYGTAWAGSYFVQPSDYALNTLYPAGDVRKDVNILRITNSDGSSNVIVSKYWDVQPIIISRLSELYLICAEGFGRTQGLPYLNAVRQKRGLSPLTGGDFAGDEQFIDEVLEERRRELFSEGFLFYDLVRTDKAIDLPNVQNRNQYVLPLPGQQVRLSEGVLKQNEGY